VLLNDSDFAPLANALVGSDKREVMAARGCNDDLIGVVVWKVVAQTDVFGEFDHGLPAPRDHLR